MSDLFPVQDWSDKGESLLPLLRAQGVVVVGVDGVVMSNNPTLAKQIHDAYDYAAVLKAEKLKALADFRWQKEIGGIVINTLMIETTDRSKTLVTGAMLMASQDPAATFEFKTTDDKYVQVNASDMIGIYAAIGQHVQACFARERDLAIEIIALTTVDEVQAYDIAAKW